MPSATQIFAYVTLWRRLWWSMARCHFV